MQHDTILGDDSSENDDDLLDEFAGEQNAGITDTMSASTSGDPAPDPAQAPARLNVLPDVTLGSRSELRRPGGLMPSRSGELSPIRIAEAHIHMALLWLYRFGWSVREVLDALRGTKGDGLTKSLVERGLAAAFEPRNPTAIQAKNYICLTDVGAATIEEWSLSWEDAADDLYAHQQLPAAYLAWVHLSLLPPDARYLCRGGRIRHARAQHDLLLQRWFLRLLLESTLHAPWGIDVRPGALMPAEWGSLSLTGWRFADELESKYRRMNISPIPHVPDLELRTSNYGGNGGIAIVEIELENARKRQDEIDAQVLRSAWLTRPGSALHEDTCRKHTLILSTSDLLSNQWKRAFERDHVQRWTTNPWRKHVAQSAVGLALSPNWRDHVEIAWGDQVLHNIESPVSLVRLHK